MTFTRQVILSTQIGAFCLLAAGARMRADEIASPGGELTIRGTAELQNGTPAANARLEYRGNDDETTLHAEADAQGRFQFKGRFDGCQVGHRLHVRSADDAQVATLFVPAAETRIRFSEPLKIRLALTKGHVVTVHSDSGQPVAGAHVACSALSYRASGITGDNGTAKLLLPLDEKWTFVDAWHPSLGVAGQAKYQNIREGDAFQLTLIPSAPHRIRFIDVAGAPVPNISFKVNVKTKSGIWMVTNDIQDAWLRTGADGESIAPWFPRDPNPPYVDVRVHSQEWKLDEIEPDKVAEGLTTVRVRPKVAISGRLIMPAHSSAEGVLVVGIGFGPKNLGDVPAARAAADGSFTLWVAADIGYAVNILDSEWSGDGWTGVILTDLGAKPADVAMNVYRANLLEARVTRGEERAPIANAWVCAKTEKDFAWRNAAGEKKSAVSTSMQLLRSDASGVARFGVGKGRQTLSLTSGRWREEQTIAISSDAPTFVDFHRPWQADRKVTGRLLLNGSPYKPSPTARIEAAEVGERSSLRLPLKSSLDPDGRFEVVGDVGDFSILAADRERRLSGFAQIGSNDSTIDLALSPMARFEGAIIDQYGRPRAGQAMRIVVNDTDHLAAEDQVADDQGRFEFALVAANAPLAIQVSRRIPFMDSPFFRQTNQRFFLLPGEERRDARVVIYNHDEPAAAHPAQRVPFARRLANAARNARLGGMRVLAVLPGDSTVPVTKFVERVLDYDDHREILSYVVLNLDEKAIASDAATLKELGWPLPRTGEVALVALDGDAKQLGSARLTLDDNAAAEQRASLLLKDHLPPARDAQARLTAARAEAKRTGRKVWIIESGERCGPCFMLARWMEDQHALLEKDYVIVKVMGLERHAEEVIESLNPPARRGIPWHAITDADGAVLVTSQSPNGNIGMPSSVEDLRHFRQMLARTAQRLTAEDVDRLAESLTKFE